MKKTISLFQRNYGTDYLVRDEVVPGAEWVLEGEGVATRKLDGTAALIKDGELFKRYMVKEGRTPPLVFIAADEVDPETGNQPGWTPVLFSDRELIEAWERLRDQHHSLIPPDGTYELVGPKIQSNREGYQEHTLVPHGSIKLREAPRDYTLLKAYFHSAGIEGIVWHHEDGRMVKIKAKDFGYKKWWEV